MVSDWKKYYPLFQRHEFICKCGCGVEGMRESHMDMLYQSRVIAGVAYHINSGWRCIAHNRRVGGAAKSDHLTGFGSDIFCVENSTRWIILNALIAAGFNRIGVAKSFLHAGNDPNNPQLVTWVR